ncbi:MAG: FecR domain-containing protein, partial [Treponema sp.]|nr:FecR domain-containing protein [Treponema sp.]
MTKKRNTTYKLKKADWLIFIICSLGAVFSLGLYYRDINSFSLKNNENAVATISFKRNTAQRKFIDNDIWEKLNNQSPVYNGDKIRTGADSEVCAEFEDSGSKIQLNENSLVQIYGNKKEKAIEFIGGEIVLTSGTEEKAAATIKTGKKKISAAPNSQVKIVISKTAPKVEQKEQAPQEAVVEVIEGEAKIEDIQKPKKQKAEDKAERGEEILKAGQSAVVSVAPLEEKPAAKKEKAKKKDKKEKEKKGKEAVPVEQSAAVAQ